MTTVADVRRYANGWEVDWTTKRKRGKDYYVWARKPSARMRSAQDWHWIKTSTLYGQGVKTEGGPLMVHQNHWEADWTRRKTDEGRYYVWARNSGSTHPSAREWHWTIVSVVNKNGIETPKSETHGRSKSNGYVVLRASILSEEEYALCDKLDIWYDRKHDKVFEHRLVAAQKYGTRMSRDMVVRHLNGQRDDNRPENLVIGTIAENNMDHETARKVAMYWHSRAIELGASLDEEFPL